MPPNPPPEHAAPEADPENLGLKRERHVADLVEKQRTAGALLEPADPLARGARVRSLLMAEKFAFEERFRNGGAVDGKERLLRAGTVRVESACDELLAGAAFARDQYVHVLRANRPIILHNSCMTGQAVGPTISSRESSAGRRAGTPIKLAASKARSMTLLSRSRSSGLMRYSNAPRFIASIARSAVVPWAVMTTTGFFGVSAWISAKTSSPDRSGKAGEGRRRRCPAAARSRNFFRPSSARSRPSRPRPPPSKRSSGTSSERSPRRRSKVEFSRRGISRDPEPREPKPAVES